MTEWHNSSLFFSAASGPGSQPAESDGQELDILQLPDSMATYEQPALPEVEQIAHLSAAIDFLNDLQSTLNNWPAAINSLSVDNLDQANRDFIDQVLGEGEVSIVLAGAGHVQIQESVLTGVWRVQQFSAQNTLIRDSVEVADIPACIRSETFNTAQNFVQADLTALPEGVCNAAPLISEINETIQQGITNHVINLTLLPQTEQDLIFLDACLGRGKTTILSRGYGNCRITSSLTHNVWWVRYFNSQDKNILTSLEICPIPAVACAAPEDINESAKRLAQIMEIYR